MSHAIQVPLHSLNAIPVASRGLLEQLVGGGRGAAAADAVAASDGLALHGAPETQLH
jgi:hypothetical protein